MIIAYIILAVLLLLLAISFYFFRYASARKFTVSESIRDVHLMGLEDMIAQGSEAFFAAGAESIWIKSDDGLKLHAYFLRRGECKDTMLLIHGYRSPKGGLSDMGLVLPFYIEKGWNILLVDLRAHGQSEGSWITFGDKERYDILRWTQWLDETLSEGNRTVLDGVSMGATTALLASGLDLPESVRGIVADCGYVSAHEELTHVAKSVMHLPAWPIVPMVGLWAKLIAKFDFTVSTVDACRRNTEIPVMFVHGGADDFVPVNCSRTNFEACAAPKQLEIIEGAGHGISYIVDMPRCQRDLDTFIRQFFN